MKALEGNIASCLEEIKNLKASTGHLSDILHNILIIRSTEEALVSLAKDRVLRGPIHSYVGQEAVAAGVLANISPEDAVTSTHRGHGHYLAKGGNLLALLDELCGLETGCNGGLGGSMHVADLTKGLYGANGIVGGGVPIACGLALSSKLDNSSRIIVSFFGDGASNQGVVYESFNIAAFLRLPILFVCENNQFAQSTRITDVSAASISQKADGFGIKSFIADGLNPLSVDAVASEAIEYLRGNKRPVLLQADTYRFHRHFVAERPKPVDYIDESEHLDYMSRDPVLNFPSKLGISLDSITQLTDQLNAAIIKYVRFKLS